MVHPAKLVDITMKLCNVCENYASDFCLNASIGAAFSGFAGATNYQQYCIGPSQINGRARRLCHVVDNPSEAFNQLVKGLLI